MEQKDTLQELFNGYTPDLGQEDLFMQHLEKKLQAVEYIKQMQDRIAAAKAELSELAEQIRVLNTAEEQE